MERHCHPMDPLPRLFLPALRRAAAALALLVPLGTMALPGQAVVTTDQVRAELVAHAPQGLQPGQPVWLGLYIRHAPHWHTYWKNPGDSGLPTTLQWTLPAGASAGEIDWPTPRKLPIGPLVNYGYEGDLLLPVPLTLAAAPGAPLQVKLRADWLVCKEVCIPEGGDFTLSLAPGQSIASHAALFEAAWAARPVEDRSASARGELKDGQLVVTVHGLPAPWTGRPLALLPELNGVIDNAANTAFTWSGTEGRIALPFSPQRSESPAALHAVLLAPGEAAGRRIRFDIAGTWPAIGAAPAPAPLAPAPAAAPAPNAAPLNLGLALLLALVGGALLNLMPCVFPVLSLKVLGFAGHADDRRALVGGGIAYTVGVVASFVALAALMLALRAGGEQLGWGFQLQSPAFIALLAVLFTLIGLNLSGVYEFGSVLPSGVASLRMRHPLVDSALTGVLAVAVASPCTAPFMGASLGLAVTLPAWQALLVFAVLGLGMALPYLAASLWPALARALPRPGVWMARFRTLMAFPMFATVVWLIWVLGQQVGIDGAAALLGLLVAVAFVAWAFGTPGFGAKARIGFGAVSIALLVAALLWAAPALRETSVARAATAEDALWQPWSPERVAALRAEGRPVFVDFTAAWCVTCQVNKRTTLSRPEVIAAFEQRRVVLLRADWTRRDAAITAELARLQRNGVPVYALYSPQSPQPAVLSELLSVQEIRDALARL
jgi:thiol:disulfide interchange protein DsbD